ncbi:hypothetical protein, partial [Geobacillus stearothermophilus]|nr:hypothetical protein [Geobacillus stearothermophilus]
LKKDVRDFVEKYFLDTPEGPKSLDKSTFLEGGDGRAEQGDQEQQLFQRMERFKKKNRLVVAIVLTTKAPGLSVGRKNA